MASEARKAVQVNTFPTRGPESNGDDGSTLLAVLAKALSTKTNGVETAAIGTAAIESRDLLFPGPFDVSGVIHFTASGVVGDNTSAPKAYGFKWLDMIAGLLEMAGITRDTMKKLLACQVQFQRDLMASDQADKKKPNYDKVTFHATEFKLTSGDMATVSADEVKTRVLAAKKRLAEVEADGETFGQTLMEVRPVRGQVTFTAVQVNALCIGDAMGAKEVAA